MSVISPCILQGLFGKKEFLYQTRFLRQLVIYLCGQMILDQICSNIILLLGGFNTNNMNMVSRNLLIPQDSMAKPRVMNATPYSYADISGNREMMCSLVSKW